MSALNRPLGQAISPRRPNVLPSLLLILGAVVAIGLAVLGLNESLQTENVVVATRAIPIGVRITPEDVTTIALPLHRAEVLRGFRDIGEVIGRYVVSPIVPDSLVLPVMLSNEPPSEPLYPNGNHLNKDMVPLAIVEIRNQLGAVEETDRINIGFTDPTGNPLLCRYLVEVSNGVPQTVLPEDFVLTRTLLITDTPEIKGTVYVTTTVRPDQNRPPSVQPYACRLLTHLRILYYDTERDRLFVEATPYQALAYHAIVDAVRLPVFLERYGPNSVPLPMLDRLSGDDVVVSRMFEQQGVPSPTLLLGITNTIQDLRPTIAPTESPDEPAPEEDATEVTTP